jgi:hypothetical protein
MALSPAEKQKRYRDKLKAADQTNPDAIEGALLREVERCERGELSASERIALADKLADLAGPFSSGRSGSREWGGRYERAKTIHCPTLSSSNSVSNGRAGSPERMLARPHRRSFTRTTNSRRRSRKICGGKGAKVCSGIWLI